MTSRRLDFTGFCQNLTSGCVWFGAGPAVSSLTRALPEFFAHELKERPQLPATGMSDFDATRAVVGAVRLSFSSRYKSRYNPCNSL